MKHSKYNRYERKQIQQEKLAKSLQGAGLYVFKNPSRTGTLTLPKPTASGKRIIGPNEEFQGDSYFMALVNTQDLIKVRTLLAPEQEKIEKLAVETKALAAKTAIETKISAEDKILLESLEDKNFKTKKVETVNNPKTKKLLLDQPDRVTSEGKVEQVVAEDETTRHLHDHNDKKNRPDVLLTEHPVGEII